MMGSFSGLLMLYLLGLVAEKCGSNFLIQMFGSYHILSTSKLVTFDLFPPCLGDLETSLLLGMLDKLLPELSADVGDHLEDLQRLMKHVDARDMKVGGTNTFHVA